MSFSRTKCGTSVPLKWLVFGLALTAYNAANAQTAQLPASSREPVVTLPATAAIPAGEIGQGHRTAKKRLAGESAAEMNQRLDASRRLQRSGGLTIQKRGAVLADESIRCKENADGSGGVCE